jgi:hypothetical protein
MGSTINNSEPKPSHMPFTYKQKRDAKEISMWRKQTTPVPAGYGNFGPQSAPLSVPG